MFIGKVLVGDWLAPATVVGGGRSLAATFFDKNFCHDLYYGRGWPWLVTGRCCWLDLVGFGWLMAEVNHDRPLFIL